MRDFTLTIRAEARGQAYELVLASPALLPAAPAARPWAVVEKLARDLERLGIAVVRSPAAIASGRALVCPDLGVEVVGRVVWIEIVGFWTPEYLARKLARYRAAGAGEVALCVDAAAHATTTIRLPARRSCGSSGASRRRRSRSCSELVQ